MLRFRVTYHATADLLADVEQQFSRRGLLVRVAVGSAERGEPVELEIATPVGDATLAASVLQLMPGVGVAVELDPGRLAPLVDRARQKPVDGPPPEHAQVAGAMTEPIESSNAERSGDTIDDEDDAPPPTSYAREASREAQANAQANAQKIQLALHGDKNQRGAILRDQNRMLHGYVLRNPGLQLDEIVFMAKQPTVSPDLLAQIAARREWAERPEIAIALVRNPKTPMPLALRMLEHVGINELRLLAKHPSVREPIARAARKKLLG